MAEKRPVTSIYELLEREYGVNLIHHINRELSSVGASKVTLVKANPKRVGLTVIQLGSGTVYISPDDEASSTHAIQLDAYGGNTSVNWKEDGIIPALRWTVIGSAAGQSLLVIETEIA